MEDFESMVKRKIAIRNAGIDSLVQQAEKDGMCTDRVYNAIQWDNTMAEVTTNRRQLEEMGIEVPSSEDLVLYEVVKVIRSVAEGLAR